ncbi:MAG: response regulator [Candidatus Omnitrophica bacterium]|nr:response regulator [Candidatus Omnitrophota bacterium]
MHSRILIVDDDEDILDVLRITLESEDYEVHSAMDGEEALESIRRRPPDLAILDYNIPKINGIELCRLLKQDLLLRHMPVIMLTGKKELADKVTGIDAGADDYIIKPFEQVELLARVRMILRRTGAALDANPLTRLPGNASIFNEIEARIASKQHFAVCYADLDNFKAFNDQYGFERGDEMIRHTARTIVKAVNDKGTSADFIGHIGGDDFVVVTHPDRVQPICRQIIAEFEPSAHQLYRAEDRERGYIQGADRKGQERRFPLISLSIGVVTNQNRPITHIGEVGEIGADLKKYAKTKEGSVYVTDQRQDEEFSD